MATISKSGDRWRVGTQYYSTYDAAKAAVSGSTSTKTTSGTTSSGTTSTKTIDYNFYPDRETAEQYNARIAAARGDSSTSLASMQTATKTAYDKAGLSTTSLVNPNQTYLSKYGAPSTASAIDSGYQPYTAPTLPSYFGDITGATAGMTGYGSMIEANQKFAEQQLQMQQQQEQKQQSLLEKFMGSVKSPAEARGDAWDETGMDVQKYFAQQAAGVKEIEALTNQYNQVVAAKDAQIAQTNDKMASMNFINNQTAQIERNAAPQLTRLSAQINAKAATLEALQGNFAQAQQYVNQAVQDAVADYKFKADMYSELYRINEDSFNRTQAIYSDAFKTQMGIAEAEYNRQYEEKTAMAELLLKYPTAGIDLTKDTLADAYKKAGLAGGTGIATGSGTISSRTQQVLDGFISLNDLTPAEAQKVRDELYAQGFGSEDAPEWFSTYVKETEPYQLVQSGFFDSIKTAGVLDYSKILKGGEYSYSIKQSDVQQMWSDYRNRVLNQSSAGATSGGVPSYDSF